MKALCVGTSGPFFAPRYHISDSDGNFWNDKDHCWTTEIGEASLWDDPNGVGAKLHDLMLEQLPGQLVKFVAPIYIEVKTFEPISREAMRAWMEKHVTVTFLPDEPGPVPASMAIIGVDWEKIKEHEDE